MKTRVLHLTLHKQWFDQILAGTKKEEYRDLTDYWYARLFPEDRFYDVVEFRNGYGRKSPRMRVEWRGVRLDRPKRRFVISLGDVLSTKYLKPSLKPKG